MHVYSEINRTVGDGRDRFQTCLYGDDEYDNINKHHSHKMKFIPIKMTTPHLFKNKYRIKTARLQNYDYSSNGAYFVTICTKNREYSFGEIKNGKLQESITSKICMECWLDLPNHYPNCILDAFVIMPNHIHGVIIIANVETGFKPVSTKPVSTNANTKQHSLSEIIRGFKTFTARKINEHQDTQGQPFWQSRFYDRIIRDEDELNHVREYIQNNPLKWEEDKNNPENLYI